MENTFKDFTINIKKSLDRDFSNDMEPNFDEDQQMLNDKLISSIENNYDDDYEDDIIIDHSADDDDFMITPDASACVNTIRLVKIRSIKELEEELENLNQTRIPQIIDFDYIQQRRKSEIKLVGEKLNQFKKETDANLVLLGSTKNVVVVTPSEIMLMK